MPVTLHTVDHAAWSAQAQDAHDLERIYADAPAERLPQPVDAFIHTHLVNGGLFCCARFNDRLLGAVAVTTDATAWWLAYICVRETTRRRGVGSRLLALVGEAAAAEGCVLRISTSILRVDDQLLLGKLGYRQSSQGDYFEFDPHGSWGEAQ